MVSNGFHTESSKFKNTGLQQNVGTAYTIPQPNTVVGPNYAINNNN
jgi:hypothetical protein